MTRRRLAAIPGNFIDGVQTGFRRANDTDGRFSRSIVTAPFEGDGLRTGGTLFRDATKTNEGRRVRVGGKVQYDAPNIPTEPERFAGELIGFAAGDLFGHGTRSLIWNGTPQEQLSNHTLDRARDALGQASPGLARVAAYGSTLALETFSGNLNPLNLAQGARPAGFSAVEPTEEDARQPISPVLEATVLRPILGRRGRLLPWEEFHEERPDVPYEVYEDYRDYVYGRDDNLVRDVTFGLASATASGPDGPEARILGFRVTPLGAVGGLVAGEVAGRGLAALQRRRGRVANIEGQQ